VTFPLPPQTSALHAFRLFIPSRSSCFRRCLLLPIRLLISISHLHLHRFYSVHAIPRITLDSPPPNPRSCTLYHVPTILFLTLNSRSYPRLCSSAHAYAHVCTDLHVRLFDFCCLSLFWSVCSLLIFEFRCLPNGGTCCSFS